MRMPSLIAVPGAIVLVLASTTSAAQDKSTWSTVSKPVTTLSKSAKPVSKPANSLDNTTAKIVKQGTEKEGTPSATQTTPVSERSYEGCHHSKDSDA